MGMMWRNQKVNTGINIHGKNVNIDLIVRQIMNEGKNRGAQLEIRGVEGLKTVTVMPSNRSDVYIAKGVNVWAGKDTPYEDQVQIYYRVDESLDIIRKEYPIQGSHS